MSVNSPAEPVLVKVRYVGGCDAVDVKLPSGRFLFEVERGDTVEVGSDDAIALLRSHEWEAENAKAQRKRAERNITEMSSERAEVPEDKES